MKIAGFDIENFKGIRNAKIRFSDHDTARVHTLVGLNESGKTTLLEAMHSFSPDAETQLVVKSARDIQEQREQWVPRDKISSFTGEVSIKAYVTASDEDWRDIRNKFRWRTDLDFEEEGFKTNFSVRLIHKYKNGDYQTTNRNIDLPNLKAKTKRAQYYRSLSDSQMKTFIDFVHRSLPTVAYYPTFVFDFPKKIYLTGAETSPINRFYRQLFQDILDYDGSGFTIEKNILDRLHKKEISGFWEDWFPAFVGTSEEDKVKQVISRAQKAVTDLVFSKWDEVFGEEVGAKEISIDLQYEKGEIIEDEDGSESEPTEHDAYIRFRVKDGSSMYNVDDRSLGFRWFFSFLLFTQFRIHRDIQKPTIFLFDEPASNLHAAAQKKLLESFPAIAKSPHRLIYSTHSHYMVEPKWLEQAYIVFDNSSVPNTKIIDESIRADSSVDIKAIQYRQFVNERPNQTSYFQPIMDTLEVQPSHFDYKVGGLIVEGKGDYYFLKACCTLTQKNIGPIFPATGSGTMGSLVALHRGWGLPVRVLFDSDKGGREGKKNLKSEFSLASNEYAFIGDINSKLKCIEDVFSDSDQKKIISENKGKAKIIILRRIQEYLASNEFPQVTKETIKRMENLLVKLLEFITAI